MGMRNAVLASISCLALASAANARQTDEQRIQQLETQSVEDARRIEQLEAQITELRELVHAAVREEPSAATGDLPQETGAFLAVTSSGQPNAPRTEAEQLSGSPSRTAQRILLEEAAEASSVRVNEARVYVANSDELPISVGTNSRVSLSTSTTSSRVAINLSIDDGRIRAEDLSLGEEQHTVWAQSVDLVASAPLTEDEDVSQLFSLSGPESGFSIGLTTNVQRFRFQRAASDRIANSEALQAELFADLREPAIKACLLSRDANGNNRSETRCEYLLIQDGPRLFLDSFDPTALIGEDRISASQKAKYDLIVGSEPPITLEDGPIVSFGLNGLVSYGEFTYFDPTAAALVENDERIGFQAGATGSLIFPEERYSLSASAAFQRNYKASLDQAVCPLEPEEGAAFIACPVRDFGEPTRDDSLLLRGEWRYQLSESFAISPHLVYDALDDEVRVELPIYFIPDKDSDLTGGVRIGYDSEEDDEFILGVFVSTPFEF